MPNDILAEFIDDAKDHLQAANNHLLSLERDQTDCDHLNGLLRRLHTVKGNAGFLDQKNLYLLLHKAENLLQVLRNRSVRRRLIF